MSESSAERRVTAEPSSSYEVVVVGAGQAAWRWAISSAAEAAASSSSSVPSRSPCLARALGLADALHAAALQRAARASLSRRTGRLSDRDEVIAYLERYAETFDFRSSSAAR
jgi:hypothetical protein